MLWWFLILGIGLALVVSVAILIYVRIRKQMNASAGLKGESDEVGHNSPPQV